MTSYKDTLTGNRVPKVKIIGEWMRTFGFEPDSLVSALFEPNNITIILCDEGEKYSDLVRLARKSSSKLLQVRELIARGKSYPYIMTTGSYVERTGFAPGDALMVSCEQGLIQLQKFNFNELGF